ncbi:MAG: hypothetical protein ACI9WS_001589 [Paraglaciecola psychrophila]|jgi:hypothetical protein
MLSPQLEAQLQLFCRIITRFPVSADQQSTPLTIKPCPYCWTFCHGDFILLSIAAALKP